MNKKCFKALSLTHRLMCFCEWIDFRSCWLLVPLDQPEVLLVPEDQSLCPLTAAAVSYCCCCCCCVFEATTPTLIKASLTKKKRNHPSCGFLLLLSLRRNEGIYLFVLKSHKKWGLGWLPPASSEDQGNRTCRSSPATPAASSKRRRRRKSPLLLFPLRRDADWLQAEQMDNNAANSEKSHLIHEKSAKMYSLKLQRWERVMFHAAAAARRITLHVGASC